MIIQTDTRQQMKRQHHQMKEKYFLEQGFEVVHSKMLVGDYCIPSDGSVVVDSKQNLGEVYNNLIQSHNRFRKEADLAVKAGIKLYILIEEPGMKSLEDVKNWKNPRYERWLRVKQAHERGKMLTTTISTKPPVNNITLIKIMSSFAKKHGVEWVFCSPEDAGAKIVEILTGENKVDD